MAKYLSIVYVAGLLVYNLIVRNKLVFQERKYNFFPTGFEIISLKTNQVSAKYLWSDFKFFSLDKGCVDKQALVLNNHLPTDDKNIYLKLNKFGAYITVVVDHAYYEQLYKLIKEYLPEKFYGR